MKFAHWSIGQRLAAGFGLTLVVLGVFAGVVFSRLADSHAAQSHYVDQVLPRVARADQLERAVLETGIAARTYLHEPTEAQLWQFEASTAKVREALRRLGDMELERDGAGRYDKLRPMVERYLRESGRIVAERRPGANGELVELRESALADLRLFAEAEERWGAEALAGIAANRDAMSRSLWIASLVAALIFLLIGYFTAQSIRRPTRRLLRVASALQHGDWKPALAAAPAAAAEATPNEMLQLSQAFAAAAGALERRERRLRADAAVAAAVSSSLERRGLAERALAAVLEHVGAPVGVLYGAAASGELVPLAQHALDQALPRLRPGEGLPGQAAKERRALVVTNIARDTPFGVHIGYERLPPRTVAAIPIVFREELLGVLLIAALRPLHEDAVAFLSAAAGQLGVGLKNALAFEEIGRLLDEVREKSEEVQAQNEALQAQNEEIQAQTEEIQAQNEEIQAQNEELQLQSNALRHQADELTEADRRKNEFLGVLAHELRNPLAPLSNSALLLKRVPPGSEDFARAQAVIERQLKHLSRLIDDLLDVTRISRGKVALRPERLDLIRVLDECVGDHWASLERNDLALELDLPETPIWVHADRLRLCQVFGNLITNAVKFTAKGGRIAVSVALHNATREVAVRVVDNGIGIDAALLARLFEPFSQGETELARTQGGLGLGLALVKGLVELHGGRVEARSDGAQRGAEFRIRLPLYNEALHRPSHEVPVVERSRFEPVSGARPRRILIIEDNVDAAHSLRDLLRPEGHAIEVAYTGKEGLAKGFAFAPEVVICDIGLPEMDGYEVARRMRSDSRLSNAVLIAVTGYATDADRRRAAAAGFDEHIAKPPDPERLMRSFERLESRLVSVD